MLRLRRDALIFVYSMPVASSIIEPAKEKTQATEKKHKKEENAYTKRRAKKESNKR